MTKGYPLGALFVVVTASAVLIAGSAPFLRSLGRESTDMLRVVFITLAVAGWGMFVGLLVGLIGQRTALATLMGTIAGAFIGAAAGMIAQLPAKELAPAAAAMTAGSLLMVAIALVMRRSDG